MIAVNPGSGAEFHREFILADISQDPLHLGAKINGAMAGTRCRRETLGISFHDTPFDRRVQFFLAAEVMQD